MMIAKGILASALACAVVLAGPASAQSLSVDDLRAQIDQKVGAQNEFQALLSDPDPARAMAAMEIMMGSGDAALMRMAVETGIFSSNPAVRATALKAFLGAKPSVTAFLTLGDAYDTSQRNWVNGQVARLGGSVTPEDVAFFSLRVGEFDAEQDCYMNADPRQGCLFRVTDQVVSFRIFDVWNGLTLDEGGELVGAVTPYANYPSAPARIPVTF